MKRLAILGATGSIGRSTLSLLDDHPHAFRATTLAAHGNWRDLVEPIRRYRPELVALHDPAAADSLRKVFPRLNIASGQEGVIQAATHPDVDLVLAGITGAAGLLPVHQAIQAGKDVALANKETLVMAGELILDLVKKRGTRLLPVDSEHSALHQCLEGSEREAVRRLLLTASGGPFFGRTSEELKRVSVEEALDHPTWKMGPKITVDSATLMNKGLEVIEAFHLFGIETERIEIVIHPQSIIHSMVEFVDGSILAQMGVTDMRPTILYALSYPERKASLLPPLDLFSLPALEFFPPDAARFPCLSLAYQALRQGRTYPATLNAANEEAVAAFLQGRISFESIPRIIREVLELHLPGNVGDLESVLEADRTARTTTRRTIQGLVLR